MSKEFPFIIIFIHFWLDAILDTLSCGTIGADDLYRMYEPLDSFMNGDQPIPSNFEYIFSLVVLITAAVLLWILYRKSKF